MPGVKVKHRDALLRLADPTAWPEGSSLSQVLVEGGTTPADLLVLLKAPECCAEFCDAVLDHLTLQLPGIVRTVLHKALSGDVPAAKFLVDVLWKRVDANEAEPDPDVTIQWSPPLSEGNASGNASGASAPGVTRSAEKMPKALPSDT